MEEPEKAAEPWPVLQSAQDYEREHGPAGAPTRPRTVLDFGSAWERHDDPEMDR